MKSEDDPEARIRELEQPLAEAARASEAGENPPPSKWAPPPASAMPPPPGAAFPPGPPIPTPPSLPYGGGLFPSPSAQYSRSNRTVWIIAGVFVIGMIALPAAIFLFTAHQVSRGGMPTFSPIPRNPTAGPRASVTLPPKNDTAPSMPSTSVSTAPAGEKITVSGISEARPIASNGGRVSVSGITNNVVITGHCVSVTVSGIQNQNTVDAADPIQVSGSGNQVTYHT